MITVVLGSFDPMDEGGLHALVRRFRGGDAEAFAEVLEAARRALEREAVPGAPAPVLVPVPGHAPGTGDGDGPRLALVRALARALRWPAAEPPPLRRVRAVEPAKNRGARDPLAEAASLAWDDAGLDPGSPVVLLDDVLASGGTLDACVAAIRRDGAAGRAVRAVVLARAVPRG